MKTVWKNGKVRKGGSFKLKNKYSRMRKRRWGLGREGSEERKWDEQQQQQQFEARSGKPKRSQLQPHLLSASASASASVSPSPWLRGHGGGSSGCGCHRRRRRRRGKGEEGEGEGEGADQASGAAPPGYHQPDAGRTPPVRQLSASCEGWYEWRFGGSRPRGRLDRGGRRHNVSAVSASLTDGLISI